MADANETTFKKQLQSLIPTGTMEDGRPLPEGTLAAAFRDVFGMLTYGPVGDPKGGNLNGLPNVMLPDLSPDLIQVLVYWTVLANEAGSPSRLGEHSRAEMLRFALFWHFCVRNELQAGRQIIDWLRGPTQREGETSHNVFAVFPGRDLYLLLTRRSGGEYAIKLVTPFEFEEYDLTVSRKAGTLLSERERLGHSGNVDSGKLFHTWWWSRGKLLLWLQRRHLAKEFAEYNPLTERDDDKPFDLDHIQPSAVWSFDRRHLKGRLQEGVDQQAFESGRHSLGNSIGNLRWIGSRENRSQGDASPTDKLSLEDVFSDSGDRARFTWMECAFEQDNAAVAAWREASVQNDQWTRANVDAYQTAVERRTLWLYRRFYEDAGFETWLAEP